MTWRLFLWMSLPWLALVPGAWLWIPGSESLATAALRALLCAAPFALAARDGELEPATLAGACAIAGAGLCAAALIERTPHRVPLLLALLAAWALAVRGAATARSEVRDRARVLASLCLGAPLCFALAPSERAWIAALSPWHAASADAWSDAMPALAACAALWLALAWEHRGAPAAVSA